MDFVRPEQRGCFNEHPEPRPSCLLLWDRLAREDERCWYGSEVPILEKGDAEYAFWKQWTISVIGVGMGISGVASVDE